MFIWFLVGAHVLPSRKGLVGRVDTLEEELANARETASRAEAKAAAIAELKDKLAASLKAKMQEQIESIEKQEQLEKEKKRLRIG